MGLFDILRGFRWSLYIVKNGNQIAYAFHENSVFRILGYVDGYFANSQKPVPPWSLYLNFNRKHQSFELLPEYFTPDGDETSLLLQKIEAIDPEWMVKGGEPVFVEAATKKKLKISSIRPGAIDIQAMIDSHNKPKETTFFSVMDEVFGKQC